MQSLKNHLSLVVALLSILFSIQTFIIVDRSISAYKESLSNDYSLVIVSQKSIDEKSFIKKHTIVSSVVALSPDAIIKKLNSGISKKNIELLKVTLPKFYKLKLSHYPSPQEINSLTKTFLRDKSIIKVETFSKSHDTTYKLLLLFKNVITVFAFTVALVTILLIAKELKIWQLKHHERMNIMALFGAPAWLRSAVLFRLALVDALVASFIAFILFSVVSSDSWILEQFNTIGIEIVIFDKITDFALLLGVSVVVSTLLASIIVIGHKEEV